MSKQFWLLKSEPGEYSFEDLIRDGSTVWDGVRNYQARNNLAKMTVGDQVLIYHSVNQKQVVGLAVVSQSCYPDPTDNPKESWLVVNLQPVRPLEQPVTLAQIKADPQLADIPLVRQSRLSVMPLDLKDFERILALAKVYTDSG